MIKTYVINWKLFVSFKSIAFSLGIHVSLKNPFLSDRFSPDIYVLFDCAPLVYSSGKTVKISMKS